MSYMSEQIQRIVDKVVKNLQGNGLSSAKPFTRARRCVLKGDFKII